MELIKAYKYCPKCTGEFQARGNNCLVCSICGFKYYISPKPCIAVILKNQQNQILFAKRKFEPQKDFLDLSGGFIDLGETAEASVAREVKEELNLEIENIKYFKSYTDFYLYSGVSFNTLGLCFTAEIKDIENLKPADDVSEVTFYDIDKIPYDLIAFESLKRFLKDYINQTK